MSDDLTMLSEMALCITEIQLGVTVGPIYHAVREEATVQIFSWIAKQLFNERFRIAFCKALCSAINLDTVQQTGDSGLDITCKSALSDLIRTTSNPETLILDWFLLFDLKLWKRFRLMLHETYIATLLVHTTFKKILGIC